MTIITYNSTRKDGKLYQHIPADERPFSYSVEARDDNGGVFLFRSNGETVTPHDWYDAEIDGRQYTDSPAWHDEPVGFYHIPDNNPINIYYAYGGEPSIEDLNRITDTIQRVCAEAVHFADGEKVVVTL